MASERTSPIEFARQVRQEAAKVTWPTRREALVSTALVLAMAVIAAIFFFGVDVVLSELIKLVLSQR